MQKKFDLLETLEEAQKDEAAAKADPRLASQEEIRKMILERDAAQDAPQKLKRDDGE